jgi:hypothetical protein
MRHRSWLQDKNACFCCADALAHFLSLALAVLFDMAEGSFIGRGMAAAAFLVESVQ